MKNVYAMAAFMVLTAGTASAGETGIINQAGPYEAQMRFYLHPAHGFPGTSEVAAPIANAGDTKRSVSRDLPYARPAAGASTRMARPSDPTRNRSDRLAAAERG